MNIPLRLRHSIVRQFRNPTGMGGRLVGWTMGHRSSNVTRNRWAVGLLDVQPDERVLELGCGPGVALAALADRAVSGLVVGVDHSPVMISQAQRLNAAAVATGRVRLLQSSVEDLLLDSAAPDPPFDGPFGAVLAVNNVGFWTEPDRCLTGVRRLLHPAGRIALVTQPRCPGATAATSRAAGRELADLLAQAGFTSIEQATLELDPPVVCVQATTPGEPLSPRPPPTTTPGR